MYPQARPCATCMCTSTLCVCVWGGLAASAPHYLAALDQSHSDVGVDLGVQPPNVLVQEVVQLARKLHT